MKLHFLFACAAAVSLTACTSPSDRFADTTRDLSPMELANSYVPVVRPLPSDFCQRVGFNAGSEAARAGFDAATQERLAQQNARQCEQFAITQVAAL